MVEETKNVLISLVKKDNEKMFLNGSATIYYNDLRLGFEVEFVKQLFDDYKPVELKIWQTFTDTTVDKLINK